MTTGFEVVQVLGKRESLLNVLEMEKHNSIHTDCWSPHSHLFQAIVSKLIQNQDKFRKQVQSNGKSGWRADRVVYDSMYHYAN